MCENLYNDGPNCIDEANAYLACIGANATAGEFICTDDDEPKYDTGVCDEYIGVWAACAFG
jgi:hypothetical protein